MLTRPLAQDERGVDGVVIIDGPKKVLIGTRLAATKEKRSEHADRTAMDKSLEEDAEKLKIEAQTQEPTSESVWNGFKWIEL